MQQYIRLPMDNISRKSLAIIFTSLFENRTLLLTFCDFLFHGAFCLLFFIDAMLYLYICFHWNRAKMIEHLVKKILPFK